MEALRVLVVDDEPGMRMGVERALRNFTFALPEFEEEVAFDVSMAADGKEAREAIEASRPDILVLDYKLPDTQGLEILIEITQKKYNILTIMVTAYASLEVAISATKNGAFDFLSKPFTPEELRGTVRKAAKQIYLHRKAKELAEEKRQVRFQFISVLAHELKSPLAAIEGYLRIIDDRVAGDDIAKYDSMIKRSLERIDGMRKMIMDLLDLTRIESGKKRREIQSIDVCSVARDSIDGVVPAAQERGIAVNLHAPDTLMMSADSGEIMIIMNNLVTNAVKYNRDNGKVDLSIERNGEMITITCADTGIGMSAEEVDKLFGEFVRIKNNKTKNILGSGLGLSILKKLITLYKGFNLVY